jgi:hypothetical protein
MASITHQVDRWFLEIVLRLAVGIVAVRAQHLAFLDRMMRWHRVPGVDVAVTFVADERLIHLHRQARRSENVCVLGVDEFFNVQFRMWVMTIGAGHAELGVRGGMPGHGRGILIVAGEAEFRPRLRSDFAVRIVARGATEARCSANLVRVSYVLLLGHISVTAVTDVWRYGAKISRLCPQDADIFRRLILGEGRELNSRRGAEVR